jgi:hypothetical protein
MKLASLRAKACVQTKRESAAPRASSVDDLDFMAFS